jgi:hypothetical protein
MLSEFMLNVAVCRGLIKQTGLKIPIPRGMFMHFAVFATVIALFFNITPALSATCGVFVDKSSGAVIKLNTDGSIREYKGDGQLIAVGNYYHYGSVLIVRGAEGGIDEKYRLSGDVATLTGDGDWANKRYDSLQKYTCVPLEKYRYLARPACEYGREAGCCASGDPGACVQALKAKADLAALKEYCDSRPDACLALRELYQRKANLPKKEFDFFGPDLPLPPGELDELKRYCEKHLTPELCRVAAESLWWGKKFAEARTLIGKMCDSKIEENSCARFRELNGIKLEERLVPATSLPCGEFTGAVASLLGSVKFEDRGLLSINPESKVRARIEDGLVKIRHDKGGDFVFAKVSDDVLLGLDSWNRFEVFRREKPPASGCLPPVIYQEQPLSSACGLDKNPLECCKNGDTQGCNRLGNMAALKNDWKLAAAEYEKVCSKGVRVGCENWVRSVGKTGDDEGVEKGLMALCSKDSLHVACDILEMGTVRKMVLQYALEEMMKGFKNQKQ